MVLHVIHCMYVHTLKVQSEQVFLSLIYVQNVELFQDIRSVQISIIGGDMFSYRAQLAIVN